MARVVCYIPIEKCQNIGQDLLELPLNPALDYAKRNVMENQKRLE
jgi:hypothetical protein